MKYIIPWILTLLTMILIIEFGFMKTVPIEIGTVTQKTFVPVGSFEMISSEPTHYGIVVVQPGKRKAYFFGVDKPTFYSLREGDKVSLKKRYGAITGREYTYKLNL